jgi:hypothetical protein
MGGVLKGISTAMGAALPLQELPPLSFAKKYSSLNG